MGKQDEFLKSTIHKNFLFLAFILKLLFFIQNLKNFSVSYFINVEETVWGLYNIQIFSFVSSTSKVIENC